MVSMMTAATVMVVASVAAAAAPAPAPLPTVVVIRANDTLKSCYRNPVLLRAPNSGSKRV